MSYFKYIAFFTLFDIKKGLNTYNLRISNFFKIVENPNPDQLSTDGMLSQRGFCLSKNVYQFVVFPE